MLTLRIEDTDDGSAFFAKVIPASSRTAISGHLGAMLKIKVAAAPEKGKANKALTSFLAKKLGVKNKAIVIVSGKTSPVKQIRVTGLNAVEILEKLKKWILMGIQ